MAPQVMETVMPRRRAKERTTVVSPSFADAARSALLEYAWPGNVRELLHTVERACFAAHLVHSDEITPEHLNLPVSGGRGTPPQLSIVPPDHISLAEVERRHITAVLGRCGGNRKRTAEILGISERNLYRLLKKYHGDSDGGGVIAPLLPRPV